MNVQSWGHYPKIKNKVYVFKSLENLQQLLQKHNKLIPFGNGRSYGDSALSENIVCTKKHNLFLDFDPVKGMLHCQSGVLLADILEFFVPKGWMLKITPGTKLITLGGAIASDVHGKNHHIEGCFSESVEEFRIMLPDGEQRICSRQQNSELFLSTCGGMGLTGVILDTKIYLKKINSQYIDQITIKTKNLEETFFAFEKYKSEPYSVAWIDCLAKEDGMGRCLLMVGKFENDGNLNYKPKKKINIPFYFPAFVLNKYTIKAFNFLYYAKVIKKISKQKVDLETFFFPLDSIDNWNRIYGRKGFTQYQVILPKNCSYDGLKEILKTIADSGKGSFLAVLKLYGKENANYLSFPMEGYSLALDFKIDKDIFKLLDQLDKIALKHNGRIYLAKDARVSKETFEQGYPGIKKFRAIRKQIDPEKKFNSHQSDRLEI